MRLGRTRPDMGREDETIMRNERLLYIGGWNLIHGLNHRTRHMAAYLEQRFKYIDAVGFDSFYSGSGPPTASPWYKARKGISNLLRRGIKVSVRGSARLIVIRDLFAPPPLHLLVKDLWRYVILRQVITLPYDLAIFCDAENAWLAWLLKRSGRVKRLIYDDVDYFPGLEHNRLSMQLMEKRERLCVRLADAVITVGPLLAQLRIRQGARQVLVVPNAVDLSLFSRARQKVPHPPTLIYVGALSPLWSVDLAISAMPALLRRIPDIRFLIAGVGPAEAELKRLSQALDVAENVVFLGHLEYHALPAVLAEADVGIATSLPDSEFRKYASPLKLIEYMGAGLPVIATRVGQTEIIMQQADAGVLIDHSVEDFVAAAVDLLSNKMQYERYSQAAIAYAARFDWDLLMEQAYQYILHVIAGHQFLCTEPGLAEVPGDSP